MEQNNNTLLGNFFNLIDQGQQLFFSIEKNKIANDFLESQNDVAVLEQSTKETQKDVISTDAIIRYSLVAVIVFGVGFGIKKLLK